MTTVNMKNAPRCNDLFYCDTVIIQVEDELFKVPKQGLITSSEVFAAMFGAPSPGIPCAEGQDAERPIVLEGYEKKDFIALMKVVYPGLVATPPTHGEMAGMAPTPELSGTKALLHVPLELTRDEWISVLKLSKIWMMEKYRTYAIQRLSSDFSLDSIDQVLLGKEHGVSEWFYTGMLAICSPDTPPLSVTELAGRLGWETAARILSVNVHCAHTLRQGYQYSFLLQSIRCWGDSREHCRGPQTECLFANETWKCEACGRVWNGGTRFLAHAKLESAVLTEIECPSLTCTAKLFKDAHIKCRFCDRVTAGPTRVYLTAKTLRTEDVLETMIAESFAGEIEQYGLTFPWVAPSRAAHLAPS